MPKKLCRHANVLAPGNRVDMIAAFYILKRQLVGGFQPTYAHQIAVFSSMPGEKMTKSNQTQLNDLRQNNT